MNNETLALLNYKFADLALLVDTECDGVLCFECPFYKTITVDGEGFCILEEINHLIN